MQADYLTFYCIYVKLRMRLSALLNQRHNQQSAKKCVHLNYLVLTITTKLLWAILRTDILKFPPLKVFR